MDNLLKDVIAEAKLLKETAYKNAMDTINETFQPTIKTMIEAKLATEAADEDYMDDGKDATPASDMKEGEGCDDEKLKEESSEDEDDLNLEAVIAELESDLKDDDKEITESDLDEIISEVTKEMEMEDEEDMQEGELPPALKKAIAKKKGEDVDESVEDETEEDMKKEIAELKADLKEAYQIIQSNESRANEKMTADLKEAYKAIQTLRETNGEVNLLNAKLMYSHKLIKNFELSESAKLKVLEAFDRTSTVKDAKLVYATIAETLQNSGSKAKARLAETASQDIKAIGAKTADPVKDIVSERMMKIAGITPLNG